MKPIPPDQAKGSESPMNDRPADSRGTILLIDDEEIIRQLGRNILQKVGYEVITAENGRSGIEVYRENRDKIDVTILDMSMPTMSGEETFEHLKSEFPDVRVLISTGHSMESGIGNLMGRGVCGLLQKPYRVGELTKKIEEVMNM
jgi:two-component system, cell cycle sensor histidine kinase and response regulator CckA